MQTSRMAAGIRKGDRRLLSKAISAVENDPRGASKLLRAVSPSWHAFVVGVTGPPGTGKSTLVDRLIEIYRRRGLKVGVIAIDPTSPITGGALLGDRVRMTGHAGDKGVYIRSMASRGWAGGLSKATSRVIQLMDAAGFDLILIETVGIGQSDIEVVSVSHAVLVVLMPGLGDEVQVSKAGLMEVGDVYVVNKSDAEGADALSVSLIGLVRGLKSRSPSVVKVSALTGDGLDTLEDAIETLRARFSKDDPPLRLRSLRGMIVETAKGNVAERVSDFSYAEVERLARKVLAGRLTIDEAALRLAG